MCRVVLPLVLLLGCRWSRKDADDLVLPSDDTGTDTVDSTDTGEVETGDTGETDTGEDSPDTDRTTDDDLDGYSNLDGDCDDEDAAVYPGAIEVCNDKDDDCNGMVDGYDAVDALTWYQDRDGDGYGDPASAVATCTPPKGATSNYQDCNDDDATWNPATPEQCNGIDENCDGDTYDEYGTATWEDASGARTDVSALLFAGTIKDPVTVGDLAGDLVISAGTLFLCDGTWHLQMVFEDPHSAVRIHGMSGALRTFVTTSGTSGGPEGSILTVNNTSVRVEGVTFYGGAGTGGVTGGAITVTHEVDGSRPPSPNLTLNASAVQFNHTQYGGGIAITNEGWVSLEDTVVLGNTADVAGGGVWLAGDGQVSCSTSILHEGGVVDNLAATGGGVYLAAPNAGEIDSVGCDWGADASYDDNVTYDVQQESGASLGYCFPNATTTADVVNCVSGDCTGDPDPTCP